MDIPKVAKAKSILLLAMFYYDKSESLRSSFSLPESEIDGTEKQYD